jgi:hypothetical protein
MTEDRLLKDLAHVAREEKTKDPDRSWDALAAGELTPEEIARLRDEADRSPEAAAAWEAFRPLGAEFRGEIVEQAKRRLKANGVHRRPWVRWSLPPALAAALAMLVVSHWGGGPALPSYDLRLAGSVQGERSAERSLPPSGAPAVFARGNRFELLLTPAHAAGDSIEARAFIVAGDRVEELPAPPPARSADGAVRFIGVVGDDVLLPDGAFDLLVAVGRPGAIPSGSDLRDRLRHGRTTREARWMGWKLELRGEPAP